MLVNEYALCKNLGRQTVLTAEDLPRNLELREETVLQEFRENKSGTFDWGQLGNDNLLNNSAESQTTGFAFFVQGTCFAVIPYNSNFYIFVSHSRDNLDQSIENGYSVLLKFVTIEHVLNFITPKINLLFSQN